MTTESADLSRTASAASISSAESRHIPRSCGLRARRRLNSSRKASYASPSVATGGSIRLGRRNQSTNGVESNAAYRKVSAHITASPNTGFSERADCTICVVWLNRNTANTSTMNAATVRAIFLMVVDMEGSGISMAGRHALGKEWGASDRTIPFIPDVPGMRACSKSLLRLPHQLPPRCHGPIACGRGARRQMPHHIGRRIANR